MNTQSRSAGCTIPPPAEKVKRTPLDNNARDRIDVTEYPDSPPPVLVQTDVRRGD